MAEGAAGGAGSAGADEEPKTILPQSCATDDGDFERMMAKLDQLERQEAAADGRALAAGLSSPHCMISLHERPAVRAHENIQCPHHACMQNGSNVRNLL